nr:immunoglobulin light chain junction region [Mus musculus]NSL96986.1 immunoglobulin light chain junction region [Mus musculus]NSL97339.1 immunoglobulin light chain junction region [Mus musculus]NSL97351.1 immunoglobulin light chain junction region [Mus musculus]NSL97357.1 immunoglobulin light chain junction region [Mus musculus]
CQNDHSYPLTF